jgi:hypothetical protein
VAARKRREKILVARCYSLRTLGSLLTSQAAASEFDLPVYVVTRYAIFKCVPDVDDPVQVAGEGWWEPFRKAKVKCETK